MAGYGQLRGSALDRAGRVRIQGLHLGGIDAGGDLDWAWVYGTLIRNAGWTFAECWEQPACDVFEFLEHLAAYPPADVLMRLRYGIQPPRAKRSQADGSRRDENIRELGSFLGPARPLPPHLRALAEWADTPENWKK
ncbi:MAG: hypothetical protein M3O31_07050 [Acidobacteriota bacterium]|nr:hypothetical protein [Acidobacteriota bacterium]